MKVTIECSEEQARVIVDALDLYARIGIGQLHEVVWVWSSAYQTEIDARDAAEAAMDAVKAQLLPGYGRHGSRGIGNPGNAMTFTRAYDVKKTIEQAMAVARDPNPKLLTVDYDGTINYAGEALPVVGVEPCAKP
jgi:hypothetical protein